MKKILSVFVGLAISLYPEAMKAMRPIADQNIKEGKIYSESGNLTKAILPYDSSIEQPALKRLSRPPRPSKAHRKTRAQIKEEERIKKEIAKKEAQREREKIFVPEESKSITEKIKTKDYVLLETGNRDRLMRQEGRVRAPVMARKIDSLDFYTISRGNLDRFFKTLEASLGSSKNIVSDAVKQEKTRLLNIIVRAAAELKKERPGYDIPNLEALIRFAYANCPSVLRDEIRKRIRSLKILSDDLTAIDKSMFPVPYKLIFKETFGK